MVINDRLADVRCSQCLRSISPSSSMSSSVSSTWSSHRQSGQSDGAAEEGRWDSLSMNTTNISLNSSLERTRKDKGDGRGVGRGEGAGGRGGVATHPTQVDRDEWSSIPRSAARSPPSCASLTVSEWSLQSPSRYKTLEKANTLKR